MMMLVFGRRLSKLNLAALAIGAPTKSQLLMGVGCGKKS